MEIQTTTQLFEELVKLFNSAQLPFDAKVFVMRSLHNEVETEYNRVKGTFLNPQKEKGKEE